jgi:hypothetical protein
MRYIHRQVGTKVPLSTYLQRRNPLRPKKELQAVFKAPQKPVKVLDAEAQALRAMLEQELREKLIVPTDTNRLPGGYRDSYLDSSSAREHA